MTSSIARERIANLIWPAILLAIMVALAVVSDASTCSSKRQIDGCTDLGCSADVDLWSGLRLFFAPPPTVATPTKVAERVATTAHVEPANFVAVAPLPSLTILAVAPKTSPPA